MNFKFVYLVTLAFFLAYTGAIAQRSLHHWKRDLEYRLNLYNTQRIYLDDIIASSIKTSNSQPNSNVRFSDLIIPYGSLVLSSHVALPTVRMMENRTQSFIVSKMAELAHIRAQLNQVKSMIQDPASQFIYKGVRDVPQPQMNTSPIIPGTLVFKQVHHAQLVESVTVTLSRINYTEVDPVIDDTYMRNPKFGLLDSENRLFFEGRKTFWNTVFSKPLKSGCCDRLRPLHTNRMMLRSRNQEVQAPVIIHSSRRGAVEPVAIFRQLKTHQLYNRHLAFSPPGRFGRNGDFGLAPSPGENFVQIPGLIDILSFEQPEILKTIVFENSLQVDEALLSNSFVDNRLVIGLPNSVYFDLSHENYLLKYANSRNQSIFSQKVISPLIVGSSTHFLAGVDARQVNQIPDFRQFVQQSIVRIDRPGIIKGQVQFNALPSWLNPAIAGPSRSLQNVHVMHVSGPGLEVGLLNGMSLPNDIVILPSPGLRNPGTLRPNTTIIVNGARRFVGTVVSQSDLRVSGLINGLELPAGVIPLHLNDFIHSVGTSNLWFMNGISAQHLTTQSGQFDELVLRDVHQGDAQSLIMRSLLAPQPDGSQHIRAPLRIMNLNMISRPGQLNHGLLNGFRPQEVYDISRHLVDLPLGRKTFLMPVEATDCIFNDINSIANWTNHLIRIDRPNIMQTVHTKLALAGHFGNSTDHTPDAMINVNHLRVEFYPENNPTNSANNWRFSPEFYIIKQALMQLYNNNTSGRYRVNDIRLVGSPNIGGPASHGLVNQISLHDIVTLDKQFRFAGTFVMVGKVAIQGTLKANRIRSNYPLDSMDLVQFHKYRIPIMGSRAPIELDNIVLAGQSNQAAFVKTSLLNEAPFDEFAKSVMSLTKPQLIDSKLIFESPVDLQGIVRTQSALNGIKDFSQFAKKLKNARYSFDNGLQCNSLVIA